jgi:hypothetical protein
MEINLQMITIILEATSHQPLELDIKAKGYLEIQGNLQKLVILVQWELMLLHYSRITNRTYIFFSKIS